MQADAEGKHDSEEINLGPEAATENRASKYIPLVQLGTDKNIAVVWCSVTERINCHIL